MKNKVSETLLALIALFYMPTSVLASCAIELRGVPYELNSDCGYHGPPSGVDYQDICYQQYLDRKYDYEARCFRYWDEKKLDEIVEGETIESIKKEKEEALKELNNLLEAQVVSLGDELSSVQSEKEQFTQYEIYLQKKLDEAKAELETLKASPAPSPSLTPSIELKEEKQATKNVVFRFFNGLWERIIGWFD